MRELFEKLRDEYLVAKQGKFSAEESDLLNYWQSSCWSSLRKTGVIDDNRYTIDASLGKGNWVSIPWIGVFDKDISVSATKGYYIVYLFSYDMKKVYLSLNQGWTAFKVKYKVKNGKKYIAQVVSMWQKELKSSLSDFSFEPINLEYTGSGSDLPPGYELGHICGKCYDLYNLPSEEEMVKDLQNMLAVFRELKGHLRNGSVEETNNHLLSQYDAEIGAQQTELQNGSKGKQKTKEPSEKKKDEETAVSFLESIIADKGLNTALNESNVLPKDAAPVDPKSIVHGIEMKPGKSDKTSGGSRVDYVAKQKMVKLIGRAGEYMVFSRETEKLKTLGINKKAELIAGADDTAGYDIKSYDENGNEIYIEVKTTPKGIDEPFYISANEARCSILNSNKYYLYRVYDFDYKNRTGKMYITKGDVFENFEFEASSYVFKGMKKT